MALFPAKLTLGDVLLLVADAAENETLYVEARVNGVLRSGQGLAILEGDNVTLACYGNKMLTSERLLWEANGKPLEEVGSFARKQLNDTTREWGGGGASDII